MKKKMSGIVALIMIVVSYLIFRYPLFYLHGMKEFPLVLCAVGVLLIMITGVIRDNKMLPVMTALGYIVGFVIGIIFEYDYGNGLNNMWIIWLWCFVVVSFIGIFIDLIMKKKSQEK